MSAADLLTDQERNWLLMAPSHANANGAIILEKFMALRAGRDAVFATLEEVDDKRVQAEADRDTLLDALNETWEAIASGDGEAAARTIEGVLARVRAHGKTRPDGD